MSSTDMKAMLLALRTRFLPNKVVLLRPHGEAPAIADLAPFVRDQVAQGGRTTAYVCVNRACELPVHEADGMLDLLGVKPE
jgi:uncharacterized protein YyaL (SSP411 family)